LLGAIPVAARRVDALDWENAMGTCSLKRLLLSLAFALCAMPLHATVYEVSVSGLPNSPPTTVTLSFDLVSGVNTEASTLQISDFSSDGSLGSAVLVEDLNVTSLPAGLEAGTVTLLETGTSLTQFQQLFTLGTSFTFRFSTSGNTDPSSPDAFSFFILDESGLASFALTDELLGSNALLIANVVDASVPEFFPITSPEGARVTVSPVSTTVPEPSAALLIFAGLLAMIASRRCSHGRVFPQASRCRPLGH
jgi:hypothetical protein